MDRQTILDAKAAETAADLTQWARQRGILTAGERIVFSLRIGEVPIVVREEDEVGFEPKPILPSGGSLAHYQGRFLRPARVTQRLVDAVMERLLRSRTSQEWMHELLVDKRNESCEFSYQIVAPVNKALREPIDGVHYRLLAGVSSHRSIYQLWEVTPPGA